MLITTSRRPCHRARLLGRELSRVLPRACYVPRGTKTVRKLAHLAGSQGHKVITIITTKQEQPAELRFLEVNEAWRWLDLSLVLQEVRLQRDLNKKVKLDEVELVAEDREAESLAKELSRLWELPLAKGPQAENLAVIKGTEGLKLEFRSRGELVGPAFRLSIAKVLKW